MNSLYKFTIGSILLGFIFSGCATTNSSLSNIPANSLSETVNDSIYLPKLEIKKGKKQVVEHRGSSDSTIVLHIDTLIMEDRASIQFYGKKHVKLIVKQAEIGNNTYISGRGSQNNASNFDLSIKFVKLGGLSILAEGYDASNGFRTHPNGNGGNVHLAYDQSGLIPQQRDKKSPQYVGFHTEGGGKAVNASADVRRIMGQIQRSGVRMSGVPSGTVYSGSPGRDGSITVAGI
jgi:hypothetical protein